MSYLEAIRSAKSRIIIANAYFLPGKRLLDAISSAARRGVEVSLLLQGRVEYFLQHHASQYLYAQLIDAGVKIFLYQPALLHAKVAVVDDCWATIGSSNLDPFSLQLAREANIIVHDADFTRQLTNELLRAMSEDSSRVSIATQSDAGLYRRIAIRLSYFVLRFTQRLLIAGG